MKLILAVVNIAFLVWVFYSLWKNEKVPLRNYFWPALLLKLFAGICLGLVYTYYYSVGDTFVYLADGKILAQLGRTDFESYLSFLWSGDDSFSVWNELTYQQPRAQFLAKITSIFCLLTDDNYWIISCYFSGITFYSAWLLVKRIITLHPPAEVAAVGSFLFFPSVVFWTSGIIKESIAMAGLFFLSTIFLKAWQRDTIRLLEWIVALLSLWIVWNLKYYYLAIFLPVVLTTLASKLITQKMKMQSLLLKVAVWFAIFVVPLLVISTIHPNFYPSRFMEVVVTSNQEFQSISDMEDLIVYNELEASAISILKNIPWALFSGLFRPLLTEVHNPLQFFIALENTMLLVLFLFGLKSINQLISSKQRMLLFSIIMYTLLLCTFLALSTPNFGTLSRYRVGFLPFLVFLLTLENPWINKLMTSNPLRNLVR
jgi:hypothetical protein